MPQIRCSVTSATLSTKQGMSNMDVQTLEECEQWLAEERCEKLCPKCGMKMTADLGGYECVNWVCENSAYYREFAQNARDDERYLEHFQ